MARFQSVAMPYASAMNSIGKDPVRMREAQSNVRYVRVPYGANGMGADEAAGSAPGERLRAPDLPDSTAQNWMQAIAASKTFRLTADQNAQLAYWRYYKKVGGIQPLNAGTVIGMIKKTDPVTQVTSWVTPQEDAAEKKAAKGGSSGMPWWGWGLLVLGAGATAYAYSQSGKRSASVF